MHKGFRNPLIPAGMFLLAASLPTAAQIGIAWVAGHGQSAYFQPSFLKVDRGGLYAVDQARSENRWLRFSDDLGETWSPVGPRLPLKENIAALEFLGSQIFLFCWTEGVWRLSSPEDTVWESVNAGFRNLDSLTNMAVWDTTLLMAAEYGFFSWSAGQDRWIPNVGELPSHPGMRAIYPLGSFLLATNSNHEYHRGIPTGSGWAWTKLPFRSWNPPVRKGRYLFAAGPIGTSSHKTIYRSGDDGTTWQQKGAGLPINQEPVCGPAVIGEGNLFISFPGEGKIYRSSDDGETWTAFAYRPEEPIAYFNILQSFGSNLVAMSDDGFFRLDTGLPGLSIAAMRKKPSLGVRSGTRSFQYGFDAPGWVRLDLYTAAGRLAIPVFQGWQPGGTRAFALAPSEGPGSYLLRVETPQGAMSHVLRID